MSSSSERTSLNAEPKKFYFLNKRSPKEGDAAGDSSDNVTIKDKDKGLELVDRIYNNQKTTIIGNSKSSNVDNNSWSEGPIGSWVKGIFGRRSDHNYQLMSERKPLPRKVPIKVEPKVFFANERTFLAWLHMSITLASISVAIVAFAEDSELSQIYGILLLPVAIAFCCYSLWMYVKRANMIRRKDPGPYEDKFGPIALASLLGLSITINFIVKLYDMTYEHQPPSMKPTHIPVSSAPTTH